MQCWNPLKKTNHFVRERKKLRNATEQMPELYPQIISGSKICDKCIKEITRLKNTQHLSDSNVVDNYSSLQRPYVVVIVSIHVLTEGWTSFGSGCILILLCYRYLSIGCATIIHNTHTHRNKTDTNRERKTSMPPAGLEPTTSRSTVRPADL